MKKTTSLCYLGKEVRTYIDVLKELGASHNQIKKSEINNKELRRQINTRQELEVPLELVNVFGINPCYSGPPVLVLDEDESFIVLSKPSGIHCFPHSYLETKSCLNWLRMNRGGTYLNVNSESWERGLLNRLDQVTSGVLIYVKSEELHQQIRNNFKKTVSGKTYLALVQGRFPAGSHELEMRLESFGSKGQKMRVVESGGQMATLNAEKIQDIEGHDLSLVKVQLYTGLRHQIRCQLSHFGFPILGDELYGAKSAKRVFLHAYQYRIDWYNQRRSYTDQSLLFFDDFLNLNSCFEMLGD